tara:strand:+ start:164 stop:952 length:789 start_codon:yes stop_codon:yes gene_type:complete
MGPQFLNRYKVHSPLLELSATKVPWDTKAFGYPVASIDLIKLYHEDCVNKDFEGFIHWVAQEKIRLVSCRLPHDDIRSIMFLESQSFKFIEMVLHPIIHINDSRLSDFKGFIVEPVGGHELGIVSAMAEKAFGFERYHIDPRVNSDAADIRYSSWVKNTSTHKDQQLVKISLQDDILGFFVIQKLSADKFYWHLTALNPEFVGRGFGVGVWSAMISYCRDLGARYAQTTISGGNVPVLNLYSRLNARFGAPEVTLHWVKENQ